MKDYAYNVDHGLSVGNTQALLGNEGAMYGADLAYQLQYFRRHATAEEIWAWISLARAMGVLNFSHETGLFTVNDAY